MLLCNSVLNTDYLKHNKSLKYKITHVLKRIY